MMSNRLGYMNPEASIFIFFNVVVNLIYINNILFCFWMTVDVFLDKVVNNIATRLGVSRSYCPSEYNTMILAYIHDKIFF